MGPPLHMGPPYSTALYQCHPLPTLSAPLLTRGPSLYTSLLPCRLHTAYTWAPSLHMGSLVTFGPPPYTLAPNPIAYTWALFMHKVPPYTWALALHMVPLLTHGPSPYTWALSLHMLPYAWVPLSLHMVPLFTHGVLTYTWALSLNMGPYTWVPAPYTWCPSLHMGYSLTHGPSPYTCSFTHGSPTTFTPLLLIIGAPYTHPLIHVHPQPSARSRNFPFCKISAAPLNPLLLTQ